MQARPQAKAEPKRPPPITATSSDFILYLIQAVTSSLMCQCGPRIKFHKNSEHG